MPRIRGPDAAAPDAWNLGERKQWRVGAAAARVQEPRAPVRVMRQWFFVNWEICLLQIAAETNQQTDWCLVVEVGGGDAPR